MTEVTCSHELSSFSMNNSSLKLLSSYSEPNSSGLIKLGFYPNMGLIDMAFLQIAVIAEIRLTVERWTCALDYVSAVLNDRFLLFRDGPPLESLCAISTTPNQE
ncbi:hypothetical protein AYI68_g3433 [Smittium mucronatum]|uniref:Uncharacterized protein n=1 Tax=Smittium mucronatum TaxID=133383 RepID=A0A1R0GZY2_9FUNG|nr:hypothetical protein AYI68_g3433 [Smittium mucronatum]